MATETIAKTSALYETDFAEWAETQSGALRRRDARELDWDNLAEEITALARNDKRAIRSHLTNLVKHLIKLKIQPGKRTDSWLQSIVNAREELDLIIEDSPSQRSYPALMFDHCYDRAFKMALRETGVEARPERTPWTIEQTLSADFFPEV
ncbi:MAG: DUF29 domain-containing protein [Bryobacteraceae bacterium]